MEHHQLNRPPRRRNASFLVSDNLEGEEAPQSVLKSALRGRFLETVYAMDTLEAGSRHSAHS